MKIRIAAILALLMAFSWGALLLRAADDEIPLTHFSACAEVRITEIEVFVTDRQGMSVTGLTAADFKLFENGRRVEIRNFYEFPHQTAPAPDPLLLIVYIDNANIHPLNRSRFFKDLKDFLYSDLGGEPLRMMLVTNERFSRARLSWGGLGSLNIRQAFTDDPTRITFALDSLENLRGDRSYYDLERQDILREISRAEVGDQLASWRIFNRVKTYSASIFNDVKFSVRALSDFIDSLTGLAGHKVLLYVSDGFPMRAGEDIYYVLKEKYGSQSVGMQSFGYDITRQLEEMLSRANANGVTIHTLDTSGLSGQSSTSAASASGILTSMIDTVERKNRQNPLLFMARHTGGRAMVDTMMMEQALESVTGAFSNFYSLGYQSEAAAGEDATIKVKVRGRGRKPRYRRGIRQMTPEHRMEGAIRACLLYGYRHNPLGLRLEPGSAEVAGKGNYLVTWSITIPHKELSFIPSEAGGDALVRLFVGVEDSRGDLSPVREISVPVPGAGAGTEHRYDLRLLMAGGPQTLVVGALDDVSCMTSFVTLDFIAGAH